MGATILVADDEAKIVELVANYLKNAGFSVVGAANGREAVRAIREREIDCAILDINMPELDGLSAAGEARKFSDVPILFLTARAGEVDRIAAFEIGADDYVQKPFSPRELVARVRAILRRSAARGDGGGGRISFGDIAVDTGKRSCLVDGKPVEMTAAQFDILAFMMRSPGRVWNRLELLEASSGSAFEGYERTIDAHIKNLRKALKDDSERPRFIETVRGAGYRFMERSR